MVKTVMIVGGQRKNLPFFWLAEFSGTERGKMYCQINAGGLYGLQSYVAQVEVDISKGLPCFDMVGLLDSEVREARERLRVSLHHINAALPAEKITVNYSPALHCLKVLPYQNRAGLLKYRLRDVVRFADCTRHPCGAGESAAGAVEGALGGGRGRAGCAD